MSGLADDEQSSQQSGTAKTSQKSDLDYRAMVREHRKKRRDVKMTGRPPGTATAILGRPAIVSDTSSSVSEKAPPPQGSRLADIVESMSTEPGLTKKQHRVITKEEIAQLIRERGPDQQQTESPKQADKAQIGTTESLAAGDAEVTRRLRQFFLARKAALLAGSEVPRYREPEATRALVKDDFDEEFDESPGMFRRKAFPGSSRRSIGVPDNETDTIPIKQELNAAHPPTNSSGPAGETLSQPSLAELMFPVRRNAAELIAPAGKSSTPSQASVEKAEPRSQIAPTQQIEHAAENIEQQAPREAETLPEGSAPTHTQPSKAASQINEDRQATCVDQAPAFLEKTSPRDIEPAGGSNIPGQAPLIEKEPAPTQRIDSTDGSPYQEPMSEGTNKPETPGADRTPIEKPDDGKAALLSPKELTRVLKEQARNAKGFLTEKAGTLPPQSPALEPQPPALADSEQPARAPAAPVLSGSSDVEAPESVKPGAALEAQTPAEAQDAEVEVVAAQDVQGVKSPTRVMRYSTELIMAGTETGIKSFTDSYGRQIEAFYTKILSLPEQVLLTSQDGQLTQSFQLYDLEKYWGTRQDETGAVVARMLLDASTGVIVGENLLTRSFLRLELDGDRVEQVRTPAGVKETIYFATEKNAKDSTGNPKITSRYCEYTAANVLIRKDDYMSNGITETCFYDANLRLLQLERRLRAITRLFQHNGITEKSHEEYTYHSERHEAVRTRGTYTDAAGKVTDMHFVPGDSSPQKIKITDSFGFVTELQKSAPGSWTGTCADKAGKLLEDVAFDGRTLLYKKRASQILSRTEQFVLLHCTEVKRPALQFDLPVWDAELAAASVGSSAGARRLTYAGGRVDVVEKDGTVTWEGDAGERSFAAPGGEVLVTNTEGGAIRLHRNFSIEIKEGVTGKFVPVRLSEASSEFLAKHRSRLDMRDFAEFARQWLSKPDKMELVLRQLDHLIQARYRDVTPEQVQRIAATIMHHLAYPREIYQGHAGTACATVIQRLLAAEFPFRYAAMIKEALTGHLTIAGPAVVDLSVPNLLADDLSGRDNVSRLFQTAVECAAAHPDSEYTNSWTGIAAPNEKNRIVSAAHTAEELSSLIHKVSGIDIGIVQVSSPQDLRQAYCLGGKRTMIIAVKGNEAPFGAHGHAARHLVTINGIIEGRNCRFLISNQLGSAFDHSIRKTAVDARQVFESMLKCAEAGQERHGVALVHGGQHGTRYRIHDGRLVKTS